MQFHLDGYRPGDPAIADAEAALPPRVPIRPLPDEVDVLIVGSGPTGLVVAAQLAEFPDLTVRLVEAKPGPLTVGQADGIACRTVEMFRAFGFAEEVVRESYWVNETVFWRPDPDDPTRIARSGRIQDVEDGLSEMPHVILNQARVHDHFLARMRNSESRLVPDYSRRLVELTVPDDPAERVVARLQRTDLETGADPVGSDGFETVRARYVVGCDGARSTVRRQIGRRLVGDAANQAWGVMDVLATTDFPDIRFKAVVHSGSAGNLLVIPREGGYLVRLYIELDELGVDERAADRDITVDQLIDTARRILSPYTLDVSEVAWWSVYEIGQRLTDRFDDLGPDAAATATPRVFIAGDACHTHSPKAGQGMNVSMRDGFNLAWKLASALRRRCRPEILRTYTAERQAVAQELIDFDREFARMFSAPPKVAGEHDDGDDDDGGDDGDDGGVDPAVFQQYFERHGRFTAGTETRYRPGLLIGDGAHQHLAGGFLIGTRFHSTPVVRLADAKPMHLGHVVDADGRWRLFAFADRSRPDAAGSRLRAWCEFVATDPRSPLVRFTPTDADVDAVIDVRAVLQQPHRDVAIGDVPAILRPTKGRFGLVDHEKVFCAPSRDAVEVFDLRSVDRDSGAVVVVRPDQHVAHVLPLDGFDELAAFFDRFMHESR